MSLDDEKAGFSPLFADSTTSEEARRILVAAQEGRFVIEDFKPLAESIEWELGQRYLRVRGSKAFTSDTNPVPFVINNDGAISANAAEVFFSSLIEAEKKGPLEPKIFVLELGIGVGLFARFFLDAFKQLCKKEGKDYYDRLSYVAGDKSEKMLLDACRGGVFNQHTGHCYVRTIDALDPGPCLLSDPALPSEQPFFRAVFLNYLLDCLPAADLRISDGKARQLCVRTCLARHIDLREYTRLQPEDLVRRARSSSPVDQNSLLQFYDFLASEYDYQPIDWEKLPYSEFAMAYGKTHPHFLHNYGAIQCIEKLLSLVRESGLILVNDYGQTQVTKDGEFEHQRYSHATFVGINFPLLKARFVESGQSQCYEPLEDSGRIHSRLFGVNISPETAALFSNRYSKSFQTWQQEPWLNARGSLHHARIEAASADYERALIRQPFNWILMNEVANYLTFTLRNPLAGTAVAKSALALNPSCSSDLWNTLGDAYFEQGKVSESQAAYEKALQINPVDVKALYNLSFVYIREKDFAKAMEVIARALVLDETGEFYERLVRKQSELMTYFANRNNLKKFLMANRVSKRGDALGIPIEKLSKANGDNQQTQN